MSELPLSDIRILDFTTLLPGPYATHLLAEMGAEVIRVESPDRPDLLKMLPPFVNGVSAAHAMINRNKRSLALDLNTAVAQDIIHRLLATHDIVIEGFRPGVMAKFGLDYEALKLIRPNLIYCSITGYGQTGPYRDRAGHDINYLALSGLASFSGRQEMGPVLSGLQIADIAGGSQHAVMALQAAIIHRMQTGAGQYLDISMTDAALNLCSMALANTLAGAKAPACGKEVLNGGSLYDFYQTRDGRYLSIGSLESKFQQGLKQALQLTQLTRPNIAEAIKAETLEHWQVHFARFDVCVEPVLNLDEAVEQDLFKQRQRFIDVPTGEPGKTVRQLANPMPFAARPEPFIGRVTGADNEWVFELLRKDS